MEFLGKHRLVPHPNSRPSAQIEVSVTASIVAATTLFLTYHVSPANSVRFPQLGHGRQEGLWKSTCFEMFLKPRSGGYDEFNFAPHFAWDAYRFSDWREGMESLPLETDPHMVDLRLDDRRNLFPQQYEIDVLLSAAVLPAAGGAASFTATIEEVDGTNSYWALRHPPGDTPNFHHPACFAAELAPPEQP